MLISQKAKLIFKERERERERERENDGIGKKIVNTCERKAEMYDYVISINLYVIILHLLYHFSKI